MESFHKSVLVNECLNTMLSSDDEEKLLVDGTLGEGGHTKAFLMASPKLKVIGVDADSEIQEVAKVRLASFKDRVEFYSLWSDEFFENYPPSKNKPDLILLDLGISMYHYIASKKGFSFNEEKSLDMRLSPSLDVSAKDIVNNYSEEEIARILKDYGEEKYFKKIAKRIIEMRKLKMIESAKELAELIFDCVPHSYKHLAIHPATKTFQALRIEVNHELDRLPRLLRLAFETLSVNGRLGVITFHSLEDRICKQIFNSYSKSKDIPKNLPIMPEESLSKLKVITRKPIYPSDIELEENNRSRSAKLRVAQVQTK
ncbi:16S rRNA (cytosine(1402)-N(4))-methyltransferase RsmH [Gemella morbillorum]|uniref:16S rRNA (cytosine(1402)-N(4))-methyltransferase RsmH n=1 Tax=Gemella morbillorum TaxID=29391 RepID=UPI00248E9659|nr:16S rRNA (cytosine(1402)-N(4))-methyltransferase RsmH [Gemella morbillorum]